MGVEIAWDTGSVIGKVLSQPDRARSCAKKHKDANQLQVGILHRVVEVLLQEAGSWIAVVQKPQG